MKIKGLSVKNRAGDGQASAKESQRILQLICCAVLCAIFYALIDQMNTNRCTGPRSPTQWMTMWEKRRSRVP